MTSPLRSGVLFDMDGTLIDSEPHWQNAQKTLAASAGVTWTQQDFENSIGSPMDSWAAVLSNRGVPGSIAEIIERGVASVVEQMRAEVPWIPGARELLTDLATQEVPCGLVTNNSGTNASILLEVAPSGSLQVVISADEVASPKPDPEPYLTAAARLGIDPTTSIAFEDSISGATSAHAAGMSVWFINSHTPEPGIPAARLIGSLAEVTASEIAAALK